MANQNPSCPLCGGIASRPVVRADFNLTGSAGGSYQVVECLGCRMRHLWPRPDAADLAAHYADDYPAHRLRLSLGNAPASAEQAAIDRRLRRVADLRLGLIRRFLRGGIDGRRVLDVGCGGGAFLQELSRRHRVEAWGLDIAGEALDALGRANPDLRLVRGDLAGADLPEGRFDLITLWHVLEHDADPVGALSRVRRWLKPGGLVLAEVPDSTGRIARLCGRDWLGWDLPRHLVHFAPATLRAAADRAGLANARVVRAYTLAPLCLSPLLASLALGQRRRRGKTRMKGVHYRAWDRPAPRLALGLVNGLERLLGGNGLLLAASAPAIGQPTPSGAGPKSTRRRQARAN